MIRLLNWLGLVIAVELYKDNSCTPYHRSYLRIHKCGTVTVDVYPPLGVAGIIIKPDGQVGYGGNYNACHITSWSMVDGSWIGSQKSDVMTEYGLWRQYLDRKKNILRGRSRILSRRKFNKIVRPRWVAETL